MMNALKEYNEWIMKPSLKWLKKHWKGYSVFVVFMMALNVGLCFGHDIVNYIKGRFSKRKDEEES